MKQVYAGMARVFTVVLIVVGAAAIFGGQYAHGFVSSQLSQEKIDMPTEEGISNLPAASQEALKPYIGEQLTTGPQAKAFADNYIWEHMMASSQGKTYEEVSGEYMKLSKDTSADKDEVAKLGQLRQTLFMGDTLRGTLLNAYGWWLVGSIAFYAGIGLVVLGVILGVLGFGVLRTKKSEEVAA